MMDPSLNKKIKVGIFIAAGFVLFVIAIFVIGGKSNLFSPTFKMSAVFESVGGLKKGSSVRFNGISIGTVDDIKIQSSNQVSVEMILERNVKQFIKKDSKAKVSSEGLVGNKIVEIIPGSDGAPSVEENGVLQTFRPVEVEDILKELKETGTNASRLIAELTDVVARVNEGQGTLGQLVVNDTLYKNIDSTFRSFGSYSGKVNVVVEEIIKSVSLLTADAQKLTGTITSISDDIQEITTQTKSGQTVVGKLLMDTIFASNLTRLAVNADLIAKNFERGSFSFAQNMEALKHNFFFKGYFEDVGYWDKEKTELTIEEQKRKLLELEQQIRLKKIELEELNK